METINFIHKRIDFHFLDTEFITYCSSNVKKTQSQVHTFTVWVVLLERLYGAVTPEIAHPRDMGIFGRIKTILNTKGVKLMPSMIRYDHMTVVFSSYSPSRTNY